MIDSMFRGDCGRCDGLCCVLLSFDQGPNFAFDKPAGEACRHLERDHRCAIHDRLAGSGLGGCVSFDCRGAGQLATRMFRGLDWRDQPATRRAIATAFALLREVQGLRLIVSTLAPCGANARLDQVLATASQSYQDLLALDRVGMRRAVRDAVAAPQAAPSGEACETSVPAAR